MKNKKKIVNTMLKIIIVYTVVGVILPFLFKYAVFESAAFSNLSNNEWAGFLGSYVGGILGGLGTLISVFVTVKESRDIQAENKSDTDKKILKDKDEREKERKEEKELEEQKERKQFADDISVYVGKYITHISKYYYAARRAEDLDSAYRDANDKLKKIENKLVNLNKEIDKVGIDSDEFIQLESKRERLCDSKGIAEREYSERIKEKERNSRDGDRLEANECYFILRTKLYNIAEANEFLKQLDVLHKDIFKHLNQIGMNEDWLQINSNLLIKKYYVFKTKYTIESTNNIPIPLMI
ncbi:hypothetical protein C1H57_23520 [Clostridium sp. 2-1]|uniref:hypothetical protein n=1 Tax=Clostridium TaxID=1485 RepID=UPI000CDBA52C|nr:MULTISPECIES: hypothetical protein [Clostridium]MBN7572799.1 hypothetical protein [Clostridium beijerinckii]MBN7578139.1 hypothetical protein [Clostridium beijerinckii]MBN7582573.1 hypothetical protein [Clostridium beijerinckii]MBO0521813.1 hypothetical protein [Clostridium beijerinckii]POO88897.1 hypothetical protein C1H57_23520 [Clostridium sp. 2-1]